MRRELAEIASREYDLVIVGGGIFGICAAWDATLRGLSVALFERADFASGASANCFKMIHGGIRYLQHGDLPRLRQSMLERNAFLRIAPHLSRPLPIFVPTYGHGWKGKEILAAGMKLYDLLTADRNRGISDPARRIPATRTVSRDRALESYPFLETPEFTGGALFHDGQMHSPSRLALSMLISATQLGTRAANYAEVTGLLRAGAAVRGVRLRDTLDGSEYEVGGRFVLNASGGWAPELLSRELGRALVPAPTFSRDAYFIVRRRLPGRCALAVSGTTRDPDALLSRSARHLFLVPWRDCTLVGVWHQVYTGDPAKSCVTEADLAAFVEEINGACPWLALALDDVVLTQCGLVLFGENHAGAGELSYGKRSLLIDHERLDGTRGLLTLVGVRYTTARADAERAIRLLFHKLGRPAPPSVTASTPIYGGDVGRFEPFEADALAARPAQVSAESMRALVRNHGSEYRRVLDLAVERPDLLQALPASETLRAEVVHAVREEMAVSLHDVVFGRTDLGTAGDPGVEALEAAAQLMAAELGWDASKCRSEIEHTLDAFPTDRRGARAESAIAR